MKVLLNRLAAKTEECDRILAEYDGAFMNYLLAGYECEKVAGQIENALDDEAGYWKAGYWKVAVAAE